MNQTQTNAAAVSRQDDESTTEDLSRRIAALEEENRILQQLAEYRSSVISRVAHELRTPLTSILGFAEILLSQERLSPQQQNFCERIQNSGQQLQNTVTQLSEIAHLDSGTSGMRFEEFALEDLLGEIANSSATHTKKKGIQLELQAEPDLPLITSDRSKLRQALRILFDYVFGRTNAPGRIDLMVQRSERGCVVIIQSEGIARTDETNDSSGKTDIALAVARHTLNLLGAKLIIKNVESPALELLIELPFHSA